MVQIPPGVIVGAIVIIGAHILDIFISKSLKRFERDSKKIAKANLEPFRQKNTRFAVIRRLIMFMLYLVGIAFIVLAFPAARKYAISMLAGAGVVAIILGFAVQKTLANIFSGIIIALTQPFRIGDRLEFRGTLGTVEDIRLRHTVIRAWNNKRLLVPNSIIEEEVIENYTIEDRTFTRILKMNIDLGADEKKAKTLMIQQLQAHKHFSEELNASPRVLLTAITDSAQELTLAFTAEDNSIAYTMEHELRQACKDIFAENNIKIPVPEIDVYQK
jgi:small-conductance mechanosensitive channel